MDSAGWPEALQDLGVKVSGQPFTRCIACPEDAHYAIAGTFVSYGGFPLCRACAHVLAGGGERAPFVTEALKRARAARGEGC